MKGFVPVLLLLAACASTREPSAYRLQRIRAGEELYINAGGHRLCVLDKGSGPPLVLLHGLGGSSFDWRKQIDLLAKSHRVIVPDMLGSGYSDSPKSGDYTFRGQAELVVALMDRLNVGPAILIGNSYGGGVALTLAVDYPDRVTGLIVLDPAAVPQAPPFHVEVARIPVIGELAAGLLPSTTSVGMVLGTAYCDESRLLDSEIEEYAHEFSFPGAALAKLAQSRTLEYRGGDRLHERLGEIEVPTLILWGEFDSITNYASAEIVAGKMKSAKLVTLPLCGHVPHMERPDLVNGLMLRFLSDFRTSPGSPDPPRWKQSDPRRERPSPVPPEGSR